MDNLAEEDDDQEFDSQQERTTKDATIATTDRQAEDIDGRTITTGEEEKMEGEMTEETQMAGCQHPYTIDVARQATQQTAALSNLPQTLQKTDRDSLSQLIWPFQSSGLVTRTHNP